MSSPIKRTGTGLFIRTIGLARAAAKLTLANIAYNIDRLVFHERRLWRDCVTKLTSLSWSLQRHIYM